MKDLPSAVVAEGGDYERRFFEAMDDDFNSSVAVSVLFDLAHDLNKARATDLKEAARLGAVARRLGGILGVLQRKPDDFFKGGSRDGLSNVDIETLIAARLAARQARNWAESDRIRDLLKVQGVILEDGKGGTTWRRE